ncbi:adenosylcobalamin-dependent ribonucleoside-diphosphate reductase [Fervidicoccus sp.]|uniref:adenosylcobalamin-dependent ribonucleoside-diphosphate reductase n=1 Tax=Fervidicoccus sp. TaxID=2060324 RepID=UPI003D0FDF41
MIEFSIIDPETVNSIVVKKRNGSTEQFNLEKLMQSVKKAANGFNEIDEEQIKEVVESVIKDLTLKGKEVPSSVISDLVEKHFVSRILISPIWEEVAKRYVLARIYNHVFGKGKWNDFDPVDSSFTFNALKVLEARYLLKNTESLRFTETPSMMFKRVARHLASVEGRYNNNTEVYEREFYKIMSELKFIPNSPTLMNAGTRNGVLSACYVIPVRDSLTTRNNDGIMDAVKAQALIQQQGGGTGFDFSELRPEGDIVGSTQGVASGPLSFMRLFDVTTEVIKQGGKRRGANMGVLHVWHPDIKRFIKAKTGELKDVFLQNFNISVGVYDSFMRAVENDGIFPLINPRKTWLKNTLDIDSKFYAVNLMRYSIEEEWVQEELIKELEKNDWSIPLHESKIITWEEALAIAENEKAIVNYVKARDLFKEMTDSAWEGGDPGVLFIDTINRKHPTWYLGKINATNPCGEEPLLEWENCNLGSINLTKYLVEENGKYKINWVALGNDVKIAIRFLDNVIDANRHPLSQITKANLKTRKIGLGVMGWAHLLAMMKIPYDSIEAIVLAYKLSEWIAYNAYLESIELAKEKGPFPEFKPDLYRPIWRDARKIEDLLSIANIEHGNIESIIKAFDTPEIDWNKLEEEYRKYGLRNATVTSIAPTGTISIIGGTSSSIEPLFALAFMRIVSVGTFIEIDKVFLKELEKLGLDTPNLISKIAETGSIQGMDEISEELKRVFKTAHDIDPIWHMLQQASWQVWVDAGTSKTINLRRDEPPETVYNIYLLAWKLGIKGITVYRDKSKSIQVLEKGIKKENKTVDNHVKEAVGELHETRKSVKKIRIGKKEIVAAEEDYAGGCPTCET